MQRVHTSSRHSRFKIILCFVWSCLGYEDNDFGRVTFYWSLGAIRKRIFSWVLISTGLNPHASHILNLEQFVAKEAEGCPSWVNTTLHRAHFTHANIFLRVAEEPEPGSARMVSCVFLKKVIFILTGHVSRAVNVAWFPATSTSTTRCTLSTLSLARWYPLWSTPWRTVWSLGCTKIRLLVYEPNVTVEASSAEVAPMLSPSRRASFGSTYNSREDVATTLVSSEVDKRQKLVNVGFTAVHAEERGKCSTSKHLSIWQRKFCARSSHSPVTVKLAAMYSHKRKSSRDPQSSQESYSERIFAEHREVRDFLDFRADTAAQGEKAALPKLSEAEHHTRLLLDEMIMQEW